MKVLKVLYDNFTNNINRKAGDWDDTINIPDIAEIVTDDDKEKNNPFCSDFWQNYTFLKPNISNFHPDTNCIIENYKQ